MYEIRESRPADAALLPAIERSAGQVFLTIPDLAWIADDDIQSVDMHLKLISDGYSLVAVNGQDVPVGFLNAERQGNALHILELSVGLTFQGQSIGSMLVRRAIADAKRQGLSAITLTTFRNVAWNRPFYEKLGFRTVNEIDLPLYLQSILDCEVRSGLLREERCAMRLALEESHS